MHIKCNKDSINALRFTSIVQLERGSGQQPAAEVSVRQLRLPDQGAVHHVRLQELRGRHRRLHGTPAGLQRLWTVRNGVGPYLSAAKATQPKLNDLKTTCFRRSRR